MTSEIITTIDLDKTYDDNGVPVHALRSVSMSVIKGEFTVIAGDEITISLGGQVFGGSDFSEYWYYPHSAFLKADVFF